MPEVLSFGDAGFGDELLLGTAVTIQLAIFSLIVGIVLGLAIASAKLSENAALRWAGEIYTNIIRGVPEFLVVLVVFFGASQVLQNIAGLFGHTGYIEVRPMVAGTVALGMVFGAFSSEVFRGAFLAVPAGQIEAARACGMSALQAFLRIRMPQMWRFAIPGLGNLWMVLLKDTSLVSVIALDELLRWSKVGAETTKEPFTFYLAATIIYLLLTIMSDGVRAVAEKRASRGVRRA